MSSSWARSAAVAGLFALVSACEPSIEPLGPGPGSCQPNAESSGLELCNNRDDDCDGRVDESPSGAPLRRACSSMCGGGTEECLAGAWGGCSAPAPSEELCNGLDDDCDQETDEGCGCVHGSTRPCGLDVGACRPGIEQCVDGAWQEGCFGAVAPAEAETCNNAVDDDCDGRIDEGCECRAGETQSCGSDVGECAAGRLTCGADSRWGAVCQGEVEPAVEVCNGRDDDCDGSRDWNEAIGFGWRADGLEPNDQCANATALADAVDGGAWITIPVRDPQDLRTFPSAYPLGEADWYTFRAEAVSHGACIPGTRQCAFVLLVDLELSAGADPSDYELCVAVVERCADATAPALFCSSAGQWRADLSSYRLAFKWPGTCGADDSRQVRARVRSRESASACGYYQLHARFDFDPDEPCP
jgi:hypothetical protein